MIHCMTNTGTSLNRRPTASGEPNHRQELALERVEFAVEELATVLLSHCRAHGLANVAIGDIRKAVRPVLVDILAD
jgi:hypothetical protein